MKSASLALLLLPALGIAVMAPREGSSRSAGAPLRLEGASQKVGKGTVRAYVIVDSADAPIEVGVALSEGAMEGLPAPMKMDHAMADGGEHLDMHSWNLELPGKNPTPYKFVQFGWNPKGHEPPGVWDVPHFDFHFYTVSLDVVKSIDPSLPDFAQKAEKYPADALRAQFYIDAATAAKTTRQAMTIPQMGMHWIDVRTPEVQGIAGNAAGYKPFTKTYIYGSWNGEFIFAEPMITRAHLLSKKAGADSAARDEVIPVPSAHFEKPGYYPEAYRITYDAKSKEYRIALVQFAKKS